MSKRGNPTKHVGFDNAAEEAAEKSGESLANGKKMIAAAARKASPAAKKANPRLNRVKGA